jgi:hypothetical protein
MFVCKEDATGLDLPNQSACDDVLQPHRTPGHRSFGDASFTKSFIGWWPLVWCMLVLSCVCASGSPGLQQPIQNTSEMLLCLIGPLFITSYWKPRARRPLQA